jgi:deazaflavin-dependent oxidoreductase (nitroreductase family)
MKQNIGNRVVSAILRSPLHPLLGRDFALIEFTGRRSGQTYSVPVNAFAEGEGFLIISRRDRTWWRNLRQRPAARLRRRGRTQAVQARVVEAPPEVADLLRAHLRQRPSHARYFAVAIDGEGEPDATQIGTAALDRVLIRLQPD